MTRRSSSVVYHVRGGAEDAGTQVEEFFTSRGWARRVRADGTITYVRGSRRRTILLGALAGKRFFLTAVIEVRGREHAAEIHYRWSGGAGQALGGTIGRNRAHRVHEQTAAELETQLERTGRLLRARRG